MKPVSDHSIHEVRSLYAHRIISKKLQENPELLNKAWENLAKCRTKADLDVFTEWEILLRAPLQKLCEFITRDDELLKRLRQSSPFQGFITPEERAMIHEQVKFRASNPGSSGYNR